MRPHYLVLFVTSFILFGCADAFSSPIFVKDKASTVIPDKNNGVSIDLPDFDELFTRIQAVSPLARNVIKQNLDASSSLQQQDDTGMEWEVMEAKKRKTVHQIEKIDNFQNLGCPILRFRSTLEGPCLGMTFADFITDYNHRKQWDINIQKMELRHDFDPCLVNKSIENKEYGSCKRLGVGYQQTKKNFVVSSREELILAGVQQFSNGASILWGTEMESKYDHLFPPGERHTRATNHLFATALCPTGQNTFDVEYVMQLDSGGKIPTWMTTPVIAESVKSLFEYAKKYYGSCPQNEVDNLLFV